MMLVAAAIVHWIGAALVLANHFNNEPVWSYSPSVHRLAALAAHTLFAG